MAVFGLVDKGLGGGVYGFWRLPKYIAFLVGACDWVFPKLLMPRGARRLIMTDVAKTYADVQHILSLLRDLEAAVQATGRALTALNVPRPEIPLLTAAQVGALYDHSSVVGVTHDGKTVNELEFKRGPIDLTVAFVVDTYDCELKPGEYVRFGEKGSYRYMVASGTPNGDFQLVVPCAAPALMAEVKDSSDADGDEVGTLTIDMTFADAMVDGVLKVCGDAFALSLADGRYDVTDAVGEVRAFTTDGDDTKENDYWVVIELEPAAVVATADEDDGA